MAKATDGRRKNRVEREVQHCIARYLLSGFIKDELPGIITVAAVRMPLDFRAARVYVSVLPGNEESPEIDKNVMEKTVALLQRRSGEIQRFLDQELELRFCPKLTFYPDEETDRILKVEKLIAELKKK